ncbi:MAG: xanthine dehydrogenase family protein subunit M [Candidatus Nanopelagicales bacterium]
MQTPAPFEYERATSVDHALALLDRVGPESRIIAGGHSLLPMMKLRLAQADVLIDINDLTDLAYIRIDGADIAIGAMTRHADILDSAVLREHYRIFQEAEHVIADPVVRNRGTIGGSLCQADPSEDLSAVCAALGATMVLRSSSGTRSVSAREFHVGAYETAATSTELLMEVRVPIRPGAGSAYEKVERRAGDWAIAAGGTFVQLDGGTIRDVGIGITAVGAPQFCAPAAEESLRGKPVTEENLVAAAQLAAQATSPTVDQRGPIDYKRHLAGELILRALRRSAARAAGEEG